MNFEEFKIFTKPNHGQASNLCYILKHIINEKKINACLIQVKNWENWYLVLQILSSSE